VIAAVFYFSECICDPRAAKDILALPKFLGFVVQILGTHTGIVTGFGLCFMPTVGDAVFKGAIPLVIHFDFGDSFPLKPAWILGRSAEARLIVPVSPQASGLAGGAWSSQRTILKFAETLAAHGQAVPSPIRYQWC